MKLHIPQCALPVVVCIAFASQSSAATLRSNRGHSSRFVRTSFRRNDSLLPEDWTGYREGLSCSGLVPGKIDPSEIQCPQQCPYLRVEPTKLCRFTCVTADRCASKDPLSNFANPHTNRCEMCDVPACAQCAGTRRTCAVCQDGFELKGGSCLGLTRYYWYAFYLVAALLVILVAIYIFRLWRRPKVNEDVFEQAVRFRKYAKPRNKYDENKLFNLWHTNLRTEFITGVGLMLHFNWQLAVICWTAVLMLVLLIFRFQFPERPEVVKHGISSGDSFEACMHQLAIQTHDVKSMEWSYFWVVFWIYIGSTLATIGLATYFANLFHHHLSEDITIGHFALLVRGLPQDKEFDDLEGELTNFFRESFPNLRVVGVSVSWSLEPDLADQMTTHLQRDLEDLDLETTERIGLNKELVAPRFSIEEGRQCCDHNMGFMDVLLGAPTPTADMPDNATPRVGPVLKSLRTSGKAFVIFNTRKDCKIALDQTGGKKLKFYGEHQISIEEYTLEPDTILWQNHSVHHMQKWKRLAIGGVVVVILIFLLDACFYIPYVRYVMSYEGVSGMQGGQFVQSFILGAACALSNVILFAVIEVIMAKCSFHFQDEKDMYHLIFYTCTVFVNTLVDMGTLLIMARGFSLQLFLTEQDTTGVFSAQAIAEHPAIQRELYVQIVAYLFPSALFIPYLAEPLTRGVLSYYIYAWLVRSRPDITVVDAEQFLACPRFDLLRYGDIVVNLAICTATLAFTYRDLWQIFAWLLASMLFIYAWDHYRFLRLSSRTIFSSFAMARTGLNLMAIPCSIMCMALVWRLYAAQHGGFSERYVEELLLGASSWQVGELIKELFDNKIVMTMLTAGALHVLLHVSIINFAIRSQHREMSLAQEFKPYSEVAAHTPCNFFTSNPVHCLKSKYVWKHAEPCLFYSPGKDYLMKPDPFNKLYYSGKRVAALDADPVDDGANTKSLIPRGERLRRSLGSLL